MISAITSLIFGALSLLGFPIVVPVLGVALGINTLLQESKKDVKNKTALYLGVGGLILNVGGGILKFILMAHIRTH
jgi:hypothetical protein